MDYVCKGDSAALLALGAYWVARWRGPASAVEDLVSLYAPQSMYIDPQRPEGIVARDRLRDYFSTLLEARMDWRWERPEIVPVLHGFVSYWQASIPISRSQMREVKGACLVHVREGRIARHELMFRRRCVPPPLALTFDPRARVAL